MLLLLMVFAPLVKTDIPGMPGHCLPNERYNLIIRLRAQYFIPRHQLRGLVVIQAVLHSLRPPCRQEYLIYTPRIRLHQVQPHPNDAAAKH